MAADERGRARWGMGGSGAGEPAGRPRRADGPVFDLLTSKLRRPLMRPGTVRRALLLERLAWRDPRPQPGGRPGP